MNNPKMLVTRRHVNRHSHLLAYCKYATDLTIFCKPAFGKRKLAAIQTSKLLFSVSSKLLKKLLVTSPCQCNDFSIYLPDFSIETVLLLIDLLLKGAFYQPLPSTKSMEVIRLCESLGISGVNCVTSLPSRKLRVPQINVAKLHPRRYPSRRRHLDEEDSLQNHDKKPKDAKTLQAIGKMLGLRDGTAVILKRVGEPTNPSDTADRRVLGLKNGTAILLKPAEPQLAMIDDDPIATSNDNAFEDGQMDIDIKPDPIAIDINEQSIPSDCSTIVIKEGSVISESHPISIKEETVAIDNDLCPLEDELVDSNESPIPVDDVIVELKNQGDLVAHEDCPEDDINIIQSQLIPLKDDSDVEIIQCPPDSDDSQDGIRNRLILPTVDLVTVQDNATVEGHSIPADPIAINNHPSPSEDCSVIIEMPSDDPVVLMPGTDVIDGLTVVDD